MSVWRRLLGLEERNREADYTSSLTALAESYVAGRAGSGDISVTACAEAAAGLYGRCMAAARVSPEGPRTAGLTAEVLEVVGRELLRQGETVWWIRVMEGVPRLQLACAWQIHGDIDPATWRYEITLAGPDSSRTVVVDADSVLHFRIGCLPDAPWRGRSPLSRASMSASLAGWIEARVRDECSAQTGRVIPVPDSSATGDVESGLQAMAGKTMLVPSTASGWQDGPASAPRTDWEARRIGAEPPQSLVDLRGEVHRSIFAACGIPAELVEAGEGTGSREALRRFLHTTLAPIARGVEAEASMKLDAPVKLDFEPLFATDLTGRARAFGSLVMAGWRPAAAAAATGFEAEEADFEAPPGPARQDEERAQDGWADVF